MRINYNVSALIANNALNKNDNKLSSVSEKLSSGFKINHAKDNPSGLAIAKRMNLQLRGLSNASRNASDGISVVQTAEGAIQEVQEMVQRMNELAVQAANGTNSSTQRELIQKEVEQLKNEITRITSDTEFNGKKLLNGDSDHKGYVDDPLGRFKILYYSEEVTGTKYDVDLSDLDNCTIKDKDGNPLPSNPQPQVYEDRVVFKGDDGFELSISYDPNDHFGLAHVELAQAGGLRMQVGANEGEVLTIRIPALTLKTMGMENFDVTTVENAKKAIDMADEANEYISKARARLGAYQNRLEHTTTSLDATHENLTSAYSRIMDTDMSEEMTDYSNLQVLTQAGTSILAQANERPQKVLQLLQ